MLAAIDHAEALSWLREVPAGAMLRRVWRPNDWWDGTQRHWREAANLPPAAQFSSSPDDSAAHDARKHTTPWVGSTVHSTETCADELPPRMTHVDTLMGPASDGAAPPKLHDALQQRGLLPATHSVDTGFLDAELLVESREPHGVDRLGPTRRDDHWPARAGAGFDAQHCQIDGDQQHATCPAGQASMSWTPAMANRDHPVIKMQFSTKDSRHGSK